MRKILSVLLVSFSAVQAQDTFDSLRAHYIVEFNDKFFVWPVLKHRELSFRVDDKNSKKDKVEFRPNTSVSLGIGLYLFEVAIEITGAIPVNEKSKNIYGESSARDLQANIITKKWGGDIYYQRYEGFYIIDPRDDVPSGTPFPQRADIRTRNLGLSGIYIINNRKFSLRSAYNYAERQKYSKGSVLIVGTLNGFKVSGDSALLSTEAQQDFGAGSDFKVLRYTTLGLGPGYSYTFTQKKFFINGTLGIGPAYQGLYYIDSADSRHYDNSFHTLVLFRVGIGYNSDRWFGGAGYSYQSRNVAFENISFSNSSETFRMLIGYRFNEIGILKHRAKDYVPFKI